jgi:hypothetical protein
MTLPAYMTKPSYPFKRETVVAEIDALEALKGRLLALTMARRMGHWSTDMYFELVKCQQEAHFVVNSQLIHEVFEDAIEATKHRVDTYLDYARKRLDQST